MGGRPKAQIVLNDRERAQLGAWARRRQTAQALAMRARIVLGCADGLDNKQVAARLRVTPQTVSKWRNRFAEQRLDGLLDAPRRGAPRTIDDANVNALIARTLASAPQNGRPWSTRSMARELGMSQTAVARIWRAFGLQPQRRERFKFAAAALLVERVSAIVGLYLAPPLRVLALCVDEHRQGQAGAPPLMPPAPGSTEQYAHEAGRSSLLAALDSASGAGRQQRREFLHFLRCLDAKVPSGLPVHLLMADDGTQPFPALKNWLAGHPRFQSHGTPSAAAWLKQVERCFASLAEKQARCGKPGATWPFEQAVRAYLDAADSRPFAWLLPADDLLAGSAGLHPPISNAGQ